MNTRATVGGYSVVVLDAPLTSGSVWPLGSPARLGLLPPGHGCLGRPAAAALLTSSPWTRESGDRSKDPDAAVAACRGPNNCHLSRRNRDQPHEDSNPTINKTSLKNAATARIPCAWTFHPRT